MPESLVRILRRLVGMVAKLRPEVDQLINPQVGLVAVIALFLGMVNTFFQIWQIAAGTKPQLLPPDQILLIPDKYPSGYVFLRVAARVSYVNTGPPNKSSVITREVVSYRVGKEKKSFAQEWQSFEDFSGRGCDILPKESRDVVPVILTGENATSHVTYFAPRSRRRGPDRYADFYEWQKFVADIGRSGVMELSLEADVLNGRRLTRRCRLELTHDELAYISRNCAVTLPCQR